MISTKIQYLSILLLVINSSFGQQVAEYDYLTGREYHTDAVPLDSLSVFRINNINRFIYDVKIESKQFEYYSPTPAALSILQIEQQKESDIAEKADNAVKAADNLAPTKGGRSFGITVAITNETTDLAQRAKALSSAFNALEESKNMKNNLIRISLTDGLTLSKAQNRLSQLHYDNTSITNLYMLLPAYKRAYEDYKEAERIYLLRSNVQSIIKTKGPNFEDVLNKMSKEIEDINTKVNNYDYNNLFKEISNLYDCLNDDRTYYVISTPIRTKKDIIIYKITITPRTGVNINFSQQKVEHSIEVRIKGGIRFDFSAGFMGAMGGVLNKEYKKSYAPNDSMNSSIINELNNNNKYDLSLLALMHVSRRQNDGPSTFSGTVGVAPSAKDLTESMLIIGLSAGFGADQRVYLSSGAAFAKTDYLNNKYTLGVSTKNSEIGDDLTEKTWRVGWFIGITYNFTYKSREWDGR